MTLEAGKEMDRRCVLDWLYNVYRNPTVAFNTHSDEQQIEFAHDAIVLLKKQEPVFVSEAKISVCTCGNIVNHYYHPKFCGCCGKELIWH